MTLRTAATPTTDTVTAPKAVLQRKCACGGIAGVTGTCPACAARERLGVHGGLRVSEPGDQWEREADRVAAEILSEPPAALTGPLPPFPRVQTQAMESHGNDVRRTSAGVGGGAGRDGMGSNVVTAALASHGRSLSAAERAYFEPRFGYDLSAVTVHDGADAASSARAIHARAYTLGSHIVLAPSSYVPGTSEGRALMAHELTHVLQQQASPRTLPQDREVSGSRGAPRRHLSVAPQMIARQQGGGEESEKAAEGQPVVVLDQPVTFEGGLVGLETAEGEKGEGFGGSAGLASGGAASLFIVSGGEHVWEPEGAGPEEVRRARAAGARRMGTLRYWGKVVPGPGSAELDRLLNELPRDLSPRALSQSIAPGALDKAGLSPEDIEKVPDLIRRWNASARGGPGLSSRELEILRKVADLHVGGTPRGSPMVSFTAASDIVEADLDWKKARFRVRVQVPSADVLDVSTENAFTSPERFSNLPNTEEVEFQVATDERMRVLSVERVESGKTPPGFLMRHAGKLRWGGRALGILDLGRAGIRISQAEKEELPEVIGEEAGGQVGGWGGAAAGGAICVGTGIATGGFGLLACGLLGGAAGGMLGSSVGGSLATAGERSNVTGNPCPSCHQMQREWAAEKRLPGGESRRSKAAHVPSIDPLAPKGRQPLSEEDAAALLEWIRSVEAKESEP